jgi:hypothetical protein
MCHERSLPSGAAMSCRSGANAHALKNLSRIDSTYDIYLTPIHFRALNDVVDVTNLPFSHQMGAVRVPARIFFPGD